jgi:putative ABC transport system permease protein
MSADQLVEHAATLEDIRAEVLAPDRLNSLLFGVFAPCAGRLVAFLVFMLAHPR